MNAPLRIDIVSDMVCPWCAVGYNQLRLALEETGIDAEIHWHPFQLNPHVPAEGIPLYEHLAAKYGSSVDEFRERYKQLKDLGADLGFTFSFSDSFRTFNTFRAHQLLHWVQEEVGLQKAHALKLALLEAYFTDTRNVHDMDVLMEVTASLGLDAETARKALEEETYADSVRQHMAFWQQQGITGVPATIIAQKLVLNGAAGIPNFKHALEEVSKTG